MAGRKNDPQRLLEQHLELDAGVGRKGDVVVLEDEPQVELADAQPGEREQGVGLEDGHLDVGAHAREALQGVGDDRHGGGRVRPEPEDGRSTVQLPQLGLRGREPLEDRLRMLDEPPARGREADALGPALHQGHAGLALELRHLLRDGGGREAERLRRGGERPAQGHLPEDTQSADVEHKESLTIRVAT
jgi:hypothetical protein